jgi:cellulose synthase/poly-beta-1,6-N-acetylglucosamine synthase-like glycosyltransferase
MYIYNMWWLLSLLLILFFGYTWLITTYYAYWQRPEPQRPSMPSEKPFISILVPARNEEEQIDACLQAILRQNYPADCFEIIVLDDHSTDQTAEKVLQYHHPRLRLLQLKDFISTKENSYKKKALELGVQHAKGTWILTTDADCVAGPNWLNQLSLAMQDDVVCIAAPVNMNGPNTFLSRFQQLDFLILQAITGATLRAGWHAMANGANFCFRKDAFESVNGYRDIDEMASGDDMLLMQKFFRQYPGGSVYLKHSAATVSTKVEPDWHHFFQQRIRWASKAGQYDNRGIQAILLGVYLFNLCLFVLLIAGLFNLTYAWLFMLAIILKTTVEWGFVYHAARFFEKKAMAYWLFLFQPIHIVYTVSAAMLGWFGKYQWKDRTVR